MQEPSADCGLRNAKMTDWGDWTVNHTLGKAELPTEPWLGQSVVLCCLFVFRGAFRKGAGGRVQQRNATTPSISWGKVKSKKIKKQGFKLGKGAAAF